MKVADETWQRSRRTSPAAGSYIQPWKPTEDDHSVVGNLSGILGFDDGKGNDSAKNQWFHWLNEEVK